MNLPVTKIYGSSLLNEVKNYVRTSASSDIGLQLFKLVFLCGEKYSGNSPDRKLPNRIKVVQFLEKHRKDIKCINVEIFMDKFLKEMDLLTFEEFIAVLCDAIILFAESWGSICELGAFSTRDSLVKKMMVINDRSHMESPSFINLGPIARIKEYNQNSVIYTDNEAIFSNPDLHGNLIDCIPERKRCKPNLKPDAISLDAYMYEVIDIINLFGPVTSKQISSLYKWLKGFDGFSFFDRNMHGAPLVDKIKPRHVLEVLELLGYIERVEPKLDYYILSSASKTVAGFLFSFNERRNQSLRAHIVARKYKYKDWYGDESCYKNVQ